MSQILVRDMRKDVVESLKKRAKEDGRSLQSEVKFILEQAAQEPRLDMKAARALVEKIRKKLKGRAFPDTLDIIREDRKR